MKDWAELEPNCEGCGGNYHPQTHFITNCKDITAHYYKCPCGEELWTEELMLQLEALPCGVNNFNKILKRL